MCDPGEVLGIGLGVDIVWIGIRVECGGEWDGSRALPLKNER